MRSLRFKILIVAAMLVLLSQFATVSAVLYIAGRDITQRAGNDMINGADVLQRALDAEAAQLESTARALAADFGFKRAVGTQDDATIRSALANHAQRAGANLALLSDTDGTPIATAGEHPFITTVDSIPGVSNGSWHHILTDDERTYRAITVPVLAPLEIARLTLGYRIDERFVEHLQQLSGLTPLIILNTRGDMRVVAGSLPGLGNVFPGDGLQPEGNLTDGWSVTVDDTTYLALRAPLLEASPEAELLLLQSIDEAMAPFRLLRSAAFVLAAIPLGIALFGAAMLSRALTRPVQKLLRAALRIQSGDYTQPVAVRSGDELHQFAMAFNAMQEEIARREERIGHQARHDSVTGLHNRDYALEALDRLIADATPETRIAVLLIRLNGHSALAETLGHDIADDYLRQAGVMLRQVVGDSAVLARLDGDSYLLVVGGQGLTGARQLADDVLSRLQPGVRLPDANVAVNPVMGVAVFPDHGIDHDQLLLHAHVAVSAGGENRRPIRVYREGDQQLRRRNMALLQDLTDAAESNQLQLYFQPQVSVADERVYGAEALIRWQHPRFGFLTPDTFVPMLEQSGKISLLTRWAIRAAIRQQRAWSDSGLDLNIAINFSAQDLLDNDLPWYLLDTLHDHKVSPDRIVAEITEEAMVRDVSNTTAVLRRIRELGIRVAVDDFGTGYSSLAHLKHLPVDELKIDRCFIDRITENEADQAIVQSTIELARRLSLKTVAEGVGDARTLVWLRAHDVDTAQGFYWTPPLPAHELAEWIATFDDQAGQTGRALELVADAGGCRPPKNRGGNDAF